MNWLNEIFIFLSVLAIGPVSACPAEVCTCKWKGGKQTVECGEKFLTEFPDGMDAGTQVLNFSGNTMQYLMSERFLKMELINLQKIFLSRNQLMRIHDKAFRGLSNLVELDLSDNMLTSIPTETFQDYSSLMRLILSGNPIRELKSNAFRHLSFLTTLELSNCQLSEVENEAFIGLDNLEWLKLDGNRIQRLSGNYILPQSLHGINMQGNRWSCDCKMIDLHAWLVNYNIPQQGEDPKCVLPERLAGQTVKFLKNEDLACAPEVAPTTLMLETAEGRNISLLCRITAVPEATVSWWFQGQVLQNDTFLTPNLHLYYYVDEAGEDKRSELFLYNVNADDNGTFACVAENAAGRSQANYTVRVVLREELVVEEVAFSYEHFLIIIIGAGVSAFFLMLACCCLVIKCRQKARRSRKRQENVKDAHMQLNPIKCSSIMTDGRDPVSILKNGGLSNQQQDLMLYVSQSVQSAEHASLNGSQCCSPPLAPMRNYQEQNPDLINDAESGQGKRQSVDADDGMSERGGSMQGCDGGYHLAALRSTSPPQFNPMATLPRGISKEMYQHQADVHLNPGCFLEQDSYGNDYRLRGLPMMPLLAQPSNSQLNCYRTLPHKPKSALSHGVRFSMEAEFLNRRMAPPFDTYEFTKDIRYTAEGYPKQQKQVAFADQQFPSPPEGYKSDSLATTVGIISTTAVCAAATTTADMPLQQWPPCLPGYHSQIVPIKTHGIEQKRFSSPIASAAVPKRSAGAQTSACDNDVIHEQREEEDGTNDGGTKLRHLTGPLADSPDEGYVGDNQDAVPDI